MLKMNLTKAFSLLCLSGGLLCLAAGSAVGNPGPLPALSIVEDSVPRLGRIAPDPDQLIRNALSRLAAKDTLGLMLMVPDSNLMMSVYTRTPEGKASNEGQRNFGKEFYYLDNGKLLFRRLARDGGKKLDLVSWKASQAPVKLEGGGELIRGIEIQVLDLERNAVRRLHFVKSIFVDPKGCKIWGFEDDKGEKKTEG